MWGLVFAWLLAGLSLVGWGTQLEKHGDIAAIYWLSFVAIVLTIFVTRGWLTLAH